MRSSILFLHLLTTIYFSFAVTTAFSKTKQIDIATFDSGFGGFFTAKSIEELAPAVIRDYDVELNIQHYGDTLNAPYGAKTPEKIAELTANGVIHALNKGAEMVFIACNTASTQYQAVKKAVENSHPGRSPDVISIIDASVQKAKEVIDNALVENDVANFAILATPATLKSLAYPKAIAGLYNNSQLEIGDYKEIKQKRWFNQAGETIESGTRISTVKLGNGKKSKFTRWLQETGLIW